MGNMSPDSLSYWEDMRAPFPECPLVLSGVELSVSPVALVTVHSKLAQGEANLLWFFPFLFSRGPNVADTTRYNTFAGTIYFSQLSGVHPER